MYNKNRHTHSVPVFIVIMAMFTASVGVSTHLSAQDSQYRKRLLTGITKPLVRFDASAKGTAKLKLIEVQNNPSQIEKSRNYPGENSIDPYRLGHILSQYTK